MDLAVTTPRVPHTGENILARGFRKGPGGKGANAAAAVARMGADSHLVGSIGDDDFGREEIEYLRNEGVETGGVLVRSDTPTGIALILVDDNHENTILVVLGANASLTPDAARRSLRHLWTRLDALLINFEVPEPVVASVIGEAAERGIPVVLDAGPPRR
jgi:ribokinase